MERLTKDKRTMCIVEDNQNKNYFNQIHDKLSKLEDLEEELGIPLEVLFKVLKDGIYRLYEEPEDEEKYIYYLDPIIMYDEWRECWIFYDDSKCQVYCLKDYGKTWALTKEELEVDN